MRYLFVTTVCVISMGWLSPPAAAGGPYEPRVGERHPDFTLPSILDGTPVSLSQFRGHKVLLIQFAAW